MSFYWLLLGILSVWRITHLLQAEDGPWNLLVRLRQRAGAGFWGSLLDCFYCLSLWVAVPFAFLIGERWIERFLLWLAFSAGAILIERLTNPEHGAPPALYFEDKEKEDALLRKTERTIPRDSSDSTDS
jgi:hypothetical protein